MAFTGNNILPKGDMASRSLICRLSVDRPDPENRPFRHSDPLDWTLSNRIKILKALYTLLLWQPAEKRVERASETRFKTWWRLVGEPLELVSALVGRPISFQQAFERNETTDEEADGVFRLYSILQAQFDFEKFAAKDLVVVIKGHDFDDSEDGSPLRSALEDAAGTPFRGGVDGRAIGKKLQPLVDRPCRMHGGIVTLRCHNDRNHGNRYQLERDTLYLLS